MLFFVVSLYILYFCYAIWLSFLEIKFVEKKLGQEAVILSHDDYQKAGKIKIENEKFAILSGIFSLMILFFWIFYGVQKLQNFALVEDTPFYNTLCILGFIFINFALGLPLEIYEKFVKDKKNGFSTITPKIFITDLVKSISLTLIFGGLVIYLILLCIDFLGKFWWVYAFLTLFAISLLINLIYPTIIAPIFNKVKPLENSELNGEILSLLQKCGFKSNGVFVLDASKRDNRLNAYFGGLGKSKRVVLFDTLIEKLTKNEILAVLGHELGHFKNKDIIKNIATIFVLLFLIFFIFGNLPVSFYKSIDMAYSDEKVNGSSFVIFVMIFYPLFQAIFEPILSYFSRKNEFSADKFGAQMKSREDMISALVKLGVENKAFPLSHPLYSFVNHSHPTLFERISKLSEN